MGGSGGGAGDITITEIDLDNTLLLDAVNKGKARFVSDCASYLQVGRGRAGEGGGVRQRQRQGQPLPGGLGVSICVCAGPP